MEFPKLNELKDIVLYGTPSCPKCESVKFRMNEAGIDYDYVKLDSIEKQRELHLIAPEIHKVPVLIAKNNMGNPVIIMEVEMYLDGQIN